MPETVETHTEAAMPDRAFLFAPITRIDDTKWEVEGVATSEAVDSYGTIFSYDASKAAFQKWIERTANVREMHDRKAVGKGVGVFFDDDAKQVIVRSRVSRGAKDTWTKIQEGILSGYSVGATHPTWSEVEREGKKYPYLVGYNLAELSYVDNASNPDGQGLSLCRADGLDTDLVDVTEPEPEQTPLDPVPALVSPSSSSPDPLERAGARISSESRASLHSMRDQAMNLCGCSDCVKMGNAAAGQDDGDGDNDMNERMERLIAPMVTRMQTIAGSLARSNVSYTSDFETIQDRLTRLNTALEATLERVATNSNFERVLADIAAVKVDVERIAAQPAPGGPILNGARPAEKRLATDPRSSYVAREESPLETLQRLQRDGQLDTIDKQVAAASVALQSGRR